MAVLLCHIIALNKYPQFNLGTVDFVTGLMEKHKKIGWLISTSEYYDETESELH